MTKPFTPRQKYRILVAYDAQVIVDGALVPVAHYVYGTPGDERRFKMLRRDLNCAVRCACGCDTWAALSDIDFDHERQHAAGGLTEISNGRPLRRTPCHVAKSASEQVVTGWVTRVRNKLSVTITRDDSNSPESRTRKWSWPPRSFPKSSRPMQSRGFQKRWEPRT